jgi:multiple sugar transport system substrate-binding protein
MLRRQKLIIVIASIIFSLVLISGVYAGGKSEAAAPAGEKKVITFWNHALSADAAWENKYWQDIVAGFEKENPGVQVNLEWVPWDTFWTKLVASIEAGNAPDLHHAGDMHMLAFVPQGKILPIDDVLADLGGPKAFSPLLHYYQYKGHTYGLPYVEGGYLFYYNKDLLAKAGFSQPPRDWDELIKVAKAVTDSAKGVYGIGLDYSAGNGDSQVFSCFRGAAGGQVIDENGKVVFDSPQNVAALRYYTDLGTKYKVVPPGSVAITAYETTATPLLTMFGNEQIAMMVYWQLGADQIKAQFPNVWAKTGITTIPKGPSGRSSSFAATNPIYIHSQTKYPAEAKKFIKYFFKKDIYGGWIKGSGWIPGLNAAWDLQPDTEWRRVAKAQLPDMWRGLGAANPKNGAGWEAFIDAAAVQDVVVRGMSPEDAVKKAQKAYEDLYNKQ